LSLGVITEVCRFNRFGVDGDLGVRELEFESIYDDFFGRLGDFGVDTRELSELA
jgi:hypothetical protein